MDPLAPDDAAAARAALARFAAPERLPDLVRFFRAGPGGYAEGDRFIGARVPEIRRVAREHRDLPLEAVLHLLRSAVHEERLLALLLLVDRHRRSPPQRARIHRLYLENLRYVDHWDLVDTSAEHLVGSHVPPDDLALLHRLADSDSRWERRIAVLATFHHLKHGELRPALAMALRLVHDPDDLVRKAVGWMLRELGRRDRAAEEGFLRQHCRTMPRTMLRYALEHFPEPLRRAYLSGAP
jgi:3-methyladenine DNA glycosylase AlkD